MSDDTDERKQERRAAAALRQRLCRATGGNRAQLKQRAATHLAIRTQLASLHRADADADAKCLALSAPPPPTAAVSGTYNMHQKEYDWETVKDMRVSADVGSYEFLLQWGEDDSFRPWWGGDTWVRGDEQSEETMSRLWDRLYKERVGVPVVAAMWLVWKPIIEEEWLNSRHHRR